MERVRNWISYQLHAERFRPKLVANFDQVWNLAYRPKKSILQKQDGPEDPVQRSSRLKKLRHIFERCLNLQYTDSLGPAPITDARSHRPTGGVAGYSSTDGYRLPHTLCTLTWRDGSLGRGFVTARSSDMTEEQRLQINQAWLNQPSSTPSAGQHHGWSLPSFHFWKYVGFPISI